MAENNSSGVPADILEGLTALQKSAKILRQLPSELKNSTLHKLSDALIENTALILKHNAEDLAHLPENTVPAFRDRLTLNDSRIKAMAESVRQVALLPDPVGELVEEQILKNGLKLRKIRAPLGVVLMIFESRPNVITEAFSLAFKSGNAIILRGGSESKNTAEVIYKIIQDAAKSSGLSFHPYLPITNYDRSIVTAMLKMKNIIDVVVPRGGDKLIEMVQRESLIPIIKNDRGLCHAFIDESADPEMAIKIAINGKTQRPGVCNSLETLLVHRKIAAKVIPEIYRRGEAFNLRWHVDADTQGLLKGKSQVQAATAQDWDTEYLDQILNCKIVDSLEQALEHIACHGSKHSETIITKDERHARHFQSEVDAAAVYWNASTRFTDGFEFGLGGELGISTQKLHVRGPVGLRELTTPRWIIDGTGQIRE